MKNRLQTPKHKQARSFLRKVGPIVAGLGLVLIIIGMASFFAAFGGHGLPRYFWCCFVGMPVLFAGSVMSMYGYLGAVARYVAAEQVPVATDAINDIAEGTQDAVKTVSQSIAEGVKEGLADKE